LGGFVGAFFLILLVVWIKKVSFWRIADAIIPALVIGYAMARIGCFLVGDDYGIPSDLPWAIPFLQGAPPTDIAVHPTQIYETVLMAGAFAFLWRIRKREVPTGWLASIGFILMGIERFGIEFIRNTTPSPIPGLTIAQLMSFFLIAWGLVKIIQLKTISAEKLVHSEEFKKEEKLMSKFSAIIKKIVDCCKEW
jgi:phosphatidylglycerol:prolipoprotein diacylglycerol transferase